jgi:5'-3' exonuclease
MIVLVDGNAAVHLFYHMAASKARKENNGVETEPNIDDVTDWFLIRLDKIREHYQRAGHEDLRFVCVFDSQARCFRYDVYPEYKSHRTSNEEVYLCVDSAVEAVSKSDEWIGLVSPDGYEADDLIASICHQTDEEVVIHSGDKDFHQCLVADRVYMVKRSSSQVTLNDYGIPMDSGLKTTTYTASDLLKEFGLTSDRWVDYQCLIGDSADNVKGCRSVGPAGAMKILKAYPDLDLWMLQFLTLHFDGVLRRNQESHWDKFQRELTTLQAVFTLETALPFFLGEAERATKQIEIDKQLQRDAEKMVAERKIAEEKSRQLRMKQAKERRPDAGKLSDWAASVRHLANENLNLTTQWATDVQSGIAVELKDAVSDLGKIAAELSEQCERMTSDAK